MFNLITAFYLFLACCILSSCNKLKDEDQIKGGQNITDYSNNRGNKPTGQDIIVTAPITQAQDQNDSLQSFSPPATKSKADVNESGSDSRACNSYRTVYDETERVSTTASNRFIGIYGFFEGKTSCWDRLYEDAYNLVPPDTNITVQKTYFIEVMNKYEIKPVTSIKQLLESNSMKDKVIAFDDQFGDNIKPFPFRKSRLLKQN